MFVKKAVNSDATFMYQDELIVVACKWLPPDLLLRSSWSSRAGIDSR